VVAVDDCELIDTLKPPSGEQIRRATAHDSKIVHG